MVSMFLDLLEDEQGLSMGGLLALLNDTLLVPSRLCFWTNLDTNPATWH